MKIRHARKSDLSAIKKLEEECFEKAYDLFALRQFFDLFSSSFFVAELDGEVVGYVIGAIAQESSSDSRALSLAVSESQREQGVAKLLALAMFSSLQKMGAVSVKTTVHPDNKRSLALCKSLGFIKIGFEENYYGPKEDRLLLELIL